MEVSAKVSQRIKRGIGGRKNCRFTFLTHFVITRLSREWEFFEDFRCDLDKGQKKQMLTIFETLFNLCWNLYNSTHSFLLLDLFVEEPLK